MKERKDGNMMNSCGRNRVSYTKYCDKIEAEVEVEVVHNTSLKSSCIEYNKDNAMLHCTVCNVP